MRRLYIPGIALLAFSYPLTTVWFLRFDLPTDLLNLVSKAVIAIMFAVALAASVMERRHVRKNTILLYILFAFYGFRLLFDIYALGILPPDVSPYYILLYFFGLTFLPVVCVGMCFERGDLKSIHNWMLWILILANISLLYYVLFVGDLTADTAFSGRFEVRGADDTSAVLNPITVSLMGGALALFVLGRLAAFPRISLFSQAMHLSLLGLGFANLLIGGSRGPVIGFVGGALLIGASAFYAFAVQGRYSVKPRILSYFVAMALGLLVIIVSSSSVSIGTFDRFRDMFDAGGRVVEERDYIYAAAWQDFLDSPLLGHSYLTMDGLALPHNVLLEALAALGVLGGMVYLWCLWVVGRTLWNSLLGQLGPYAYSIALAAVVLIALSMTSGTIGQNPEIWVVSVLVMCMGSARDNRRRPSPRDDRVRGKAVGRMNMPGEHLPLRPGR